MIDLFEPRGRYGHLPSLADRVDVSGDCWEWTASTDTAGYGRLYWEGGWINAHRLFYQLLVGPISKGHDLDHLCRNRRCVNPDHLEPVTRRENLRRGISANRNKTACLRGHPFDEQNTRLTKDGRRQCRECKRVRERV